MLKKTTVTEAVAAAMREGSSLMQSHSVWIPLSNLVLSPENVRRGEPEQEGIEQLASQILSTGLLNPLRVALVDGRGFVVAGGRRWRALVWLASRGLIAADEPIECRVVAEGMAVQESLSENVSIEPMHAVDQFLAFQQLAERGLSVMEIASRFGVKPRLVEQRMALAKLAPMFLDKFRAGAVSLDALQALTLSDDHELQVKVWNSLSSWERHGPAIRRKLMQQELPVKDSRVRLVGLKAYREAGGTVRSDLFGGASEAYVLDVPLLDGLLRLRLEQEAEAVRAEGWKWVEIAEEWDSAARAGFVAMKPHMRAATSAEARTIQSLRQQVEDLETAYDEADASDVAVDLRKRLMQAEHALEQAEGALLGWSDAQRALAGAVVSHRDGSVVIERGLRTVAEARAEVAGASTMNGAGGARIDEGEDDCGPVRNLAGHEVKVRPEFPDRLMASLTAHLTAAVQVRVAQSTDVALSALAASLAASLEPGSKRSAADVSLRSSVFGVRNAAIGWGESTAGRQFQELEASWALRLADRGDADWLPYFLAKGHDFVCEFIAWAVSQSLTGIQSRATKPTRMQIHGLAEAVNLDMKHWWKPTGEQYFSMMPRAKIVATVSQVCGAEVAQPLLKMSKAEVVAKAEQLMANSGWLPWPMVPVAAQAATGTEGECSAHEAGDAGVDDEDRDD